MNLVIFKWMRIMMRDKKSMIGIIVNKSKATKTTEYYIMPPLTKETFMKNKKTPLRVLNEKTKNIKKP